MSTVPFWISVMRLAEVTGIRRVSILASFQFGLDTVDDLEHQFMQ